MIYSSYARMAKIIKNWHILSCQLYPLPVYKPPTKLNRPSMLKFQFFHQIFPLIQSMLDKKRHIISDVSFSIKKYSWKTSLFSSCYSICSIVGYYSGTAYYSYHIKSVICNILCCAGCVSVIDKEQR